mmetsp:Transcript_9553/g.17344  ORF Transcript_9553/g.17344 Transcript_9553/m.17344 type:complete len:373 (-) Transcript_9553:770-1888(-)
MIKEDTIVVSMMESEEDVSCWNWIPSEVLAMIVVYLGDSVDDVSAVEETWHASVGEWSRSQVDSIWRPLVHAHFPRLETHPHSPSQIMISYRSIYRIQKNIQQGNVTDNNMMMIVSEHESSSSSSADTPVLRTAQQQLGDYTITFEARLRRHYGKESQTYSWMGPMRGDCWGCGGTPVRQTVELWDPPDTTTTTTTIMEDDMTYGPRFETAHNGLNPKAFDQSSLKVYLTKKSRNKNNDLHTIKLFDASDAMMDHSPRLEVQHGVFQTTLPVSWSLVYRQALSPAPFSRSPSTTPSTQSSRNLQLMVSMNVGLDKGSCRMLGLDWMTNDHMELYPEEVLAYLNGENVDDNVVPSSSGTEEKDARKQIYTNWM